MALKPAFVQIIQHGKLISRAAFPFFVDTWNWMSSAVSNLCGDGDNGGNGIIKVDWTRSDHPVIRLDMQNLLASMYDNGCFNIVSTSQGQDSSCTVSLGNRYYNVGCITKAMDTTSASASGFLCLRVSATSSTAPATYENYETEEELNEAQADENYATIPLYKFSSNGIVEADLRNAPNIQLFEALS